MVELKSAGALALVGSGEYLPVMNETDGLLMSTLGGPDQTTVALIPAASGLEAGSPDRWNRLGVNHFTALGATAIAIDLTARGDAERPDIVDQLRRANFFYFSGGNPQYLVETMRDTPAWNVILTGYRAGAVVAGCSAGAILLSDFMGGLRAMMSGASPQWGRAMGLAGGIAVMPHFDRFANRIGLETIQSWSGHVPDGGVLVGIDEDTALVRESAGSPWKVSGRQTVSVFRTGATSVFAPGDFVPLP